MGERRLGALRVEFDRCPAAAICSPVRCRQKRKAIFSWNQDGFILPLWELAIVDLMSPSGKCRLVPAPQGESV